MTDLYVKDDKGQYIPFKFDIISPKELENQLIVITVGSDAEPSTPEVLEYVQTYFSNSRGLIEAMCRSGEANLLILPHIMKIELFSKKDLENKAVCVKLNTDDQLDNLPELKAQIKEIVRKDVITLPVPLSLKEYEEIKSIKERVRIRKQRYGGGLSK